jgi:serine/threonine protein kinase
VAQTEKPSRQDLELFLKEVQTLAKLHHRNIVQFYGACLETGSMFFVTELMKVQGGVGQ